MGSGAGDRGGRDGRRIIAQLTDPHCVGADDALARIIDTDAAAVAAVEHLNALEPRPDLVLVTGDLTSGGGSAENMRAREILDGLRMPYRVVPGNHDERATLIEVFEGRLETCDGGFVQYVVDLDPVRVVALDTLEEGSASGRLCDVRLGWLERVLSLEPDRPTLLCMHHPPFATGVGWMDGIGLSDPAPFERVVAANPQVKGITCGHVHRPIQTLWAGALATAAPSSGFQLHLDLVPGAPPRLILEPPACLLHVLSGDALVTHTTYVGHRSAIDPW